MSALSAGDLFPEGVVFSHVPPTPETAGVTACGLPTKYDASQHFRSKKVVLVGVPGAFTPTCQLQHITSYTAPGVLDRLRAKGVNQVVVISANDQWVMAAWGKANGVLHDSPILFMSDDDVQFSKSIGWVNGPRPLRYAIVVDHGKVIYAEKDVPKSIAASGAEGVLSKL